MTSPALPDRLVAIDYVRTGTSNFLAAVESADLAGTSRLPGWTNGHVAAHVALNATALMRLLTWARTGVETPMYSSREARSTDIERDSSCPKPQLLVGLHETAQLFDEAVAQLPEAAWSADVRGASGRPLTATVIPWMRVREVWLHTVDLGADMAALPAELVRALLDDIATAFGAKPQPPGLRLIASTGPEWVIGDGSTPIYGSAANLLGWLVGRSAGDELRADPGLPEIPAWL